MPVTHSHLQKEKTGDAQWSLAHSKEGFLPGGLVGGSCQGRGGNFLIRLSFIFSARNSLIPCCPWSVHWEDPPSPLSTNHSWNYDLWPLLCRGCTTFWSCNFGVSGVFQTQFLLRLLIFQTFSKNWLDFFFLFFFFVVETFPNFFLDIMFLIISLSSGPTLLST